MKKLFITIIFIICLINLLSINSKAQNTWSLNGYVSNMQSVMFDSIKNPWTNDNLIHNRLEFRFYTEKYFSFGIDLRNRIITGETVKYMPNYATGIQADNGLIDMSWNIIEEQSIIFNSSIDRAYLTFEKGNLNITVGRQRINWAKTFVWNPNNIFNSYSFFDFDYIEKPGSDAVNIEYYTGMASSINVVAKLDSANKITAAGKFGFNLFKYDFQLIGGIINEEDYVVGMGFAGNIWNFSFRGESSYLHPKAHFSDTTGLLIASIGTDYMFRNSLMLSVEFLYNQMPEGTQVGSFLQIYEAPTSVKNLSFAEFNILGSISYPFTPLINGSLSGMYFPELKGFFAGPTVSISLMQNLEFSVIAQTFSGEFKNPYTQKNQRIWFNLGFLKMKYSF